MRISATDIDDGKNSIVSYILMSERDASDMNYFRIDENTGVIFLNKSIDKPVDYKFKMKARAMDHGKPSLEQDIGVEITVVGSNRKAPTFLKTPDTLYIKENHTDFSTPLITIQASSNIPNDTPVFELLIGRTEQTNKQNTFVLEQHNDTAYIKLGKRLDYEAINEYQLIVRVQNKDNLAAQQFIVIKVEDVNDVIPVFIDIVPGSVLENEPPGTPVMQVRAIDLDGTTAHNQVTYELENVTEVQERFQIDPHTGNITTKVKFDREEKDFYKVKVIATDSSPSALFHDGRHNKGEHTFRIEIADINDNQPRFTKKMYIFEEIPEDANLNQQVGEVRAEDKDSASPVTYSIIDGNIGNAFLIENTTGKIRVKNALDYEIRTEYMLTVRAFDGAYKDEANVSIKIGNVNDNPPIFLPYNKNITIKEEELPEEECITKLEAYDPDIVNRSWPQHIVYFVVKEDQKDKLKINKDGCLSLIKSLDRDPPNGYDEWQVFIAADDEDGDVKSLRQTTDFLIHLIDINDNAPFLDMVQPVIWMENQPPGNITVLTAKDYDSDENGPPFKFVIDENASEDIKRKFYILDATLFANVTFDREEKKVYHIPIAITDSGVPPLTNTSFLMVVIGDVNDNAMKNGESSIFVYNYKGKAPDTVIGRVYVDDPDDWDIVDKHFRWKSDNVNQPFWLDTETGMITMLSGTSNSSFRLEFIVTEKSALIKEHFVEAAVNVTVKELPEEAVDKSGSIRFAGVSAEDFIAPGPNLKPSKLAQFSAYLANILNTSEENIDTFTVLHSPHNNDSNLLDVRFSVHGSPYYHPEKLNAIVGEHQEKLEIELGVEVVMINIDECLIEKAFCSELSCTNILNKSEVPYPVYTNTSSFVGVKAFVDPVCECQINPPKTKCLNGGTPLEDRCECNPGFEGPNCEILSVGFHGDGWALYPPIPACKEASLSLDVTPTKDDGLILYVGPIRRNTVLNVQDFMSLELKDGYPRLLMDYGSGTTFLEHKQSRLSDGKLHHIDIFWTNTSIEMKVDSCQMSSCLRLTTPIKPNEFLNVNGPLQLGGSFVDLASLSKEMLWNYAPSDEKFSGCIRNLTFNGKTARETLETARLLGRRLGS
ncbi:DE-cadherin [Gryllus bimaculatus]|nr:DE-cadherin [Gryllus bimaculatus]